MHLMPWFETKTSIKKYGIADWGLHWTMLTKNPDVFVNGQREIASHYYPLTGPYHSGDSAIIEYQLLLMKYCGVDGIMVDWYGTQNNHDYPINLENSNQIINRTNEVGLDFGIVYEPNTLDGLPNKTTVAKADFNYIQQHYLSRPNYVQNNGQYMLFNFDNTLTTAEWNELMRPMKQTQLYFHHRQTASMVGLDHLPGEFYWVERGDLQSQQEWYNYYAHSKIMAAYPGFNDFYAEGGYGFSLPFVIDVSARTLAQRLQLVKKNNPGFVQLITFNDYGEGTMLEPTVEFGFSFLHELQLFAGVPYGVAELELIFTYYKLRTNSAK